MANITSVALADSHLLIRAGLACLLRELCAVNVVGLASNGREAVDLVAAYRPQLVVAEAEMPVLNGLEATRNILRDFPGTRVLILSGFVGEDRILRALGAGAAGNIHKSASPSATLTVIFCPSCLAQHQRRTAPRRHPGRTQSRWLCRPPSRGRDCASG